MNLLNVAPATAQDLLELRTARIARGKLVHRDCGGQVVWSTFVDAAKCKHCDWSLTRSVITDIDHSKRKDDLGIDRF